MSRTIETTPQRFRFGNIAEPVSRPASIAMEQAAPSFAFKLLILFILIMYSNIAVLIPSANAVRPAMTVAIAAILMTVFEVSRNRTGFRMAWPESAMLIVLLGICSLSIFSAVYMTLALETTMNLARIVLIYIVIENTVTSLDRLRRMMLAMVLGGLMPAVGTLHHYAKGIVVEGNRAAWVGVFGNPNEAAYALAILVPIAAVLAMRSGWLMRTVLLGVIATYLLAIYLTFSRGGLLGLFAILALFGWKQKSFVIKAVMVGGLVAGVFAVSMFWHRKDNFSNVSQDTTFNQRVATIKAGLAMFGDNPLLGVGPGCSLVAYPLYVPKDAHCGCQDQLVIHNAFIQVLSETGGTGFLAFMVFLGAAMVHVWRVQRVLSPDLQAYAMGLELALWGFLVCGLSGGFTWSWFPYIIVALIVAAKQISEKSTQQAQ